MSQDQNAKQSHQNRIDKGAGNSGDDGGIGGGDIGDRDIGDRDSGKVDQGSERQPRKTAGQVEREISQSLNRLYRQELGHQPGKIICQLFEKKAVLVIENALSQPEQLLLAKGDSQIALQAHEELLEALKTLVRDCIAEATGMSVLDILIDSNVETLRMGLIVMLEEAPDVKNPGAIPKNPRE